MDIKIEEVQLKTGDLILGYDNNSIISTLIAIITQDNNDIEKYSHIGIMYDNNNIVEAFNTGVRIISVREYINRYTHIKILRYKSDININMMKYYLRTSLGLKYAYYQLIINLIVIIIKKLFNKDIRFNNKYKEFLYKNNIISFIKNRLNITQKTCISLVAGAYFNQGIEINKEINFNDLEPEEILDCKSFYDVCN